MEYRKHPIRSAFANSLRQEALVGKNKKFANFCTVLLRKVFEYMKIALLKS